MQHDVSLNDLYASFSLGLMGKDEFEGAVFKAILTDTRYLLGFCREEHEDYISWLYPRIRSAIAAYQETGSSFETYIGAMVRMTAKEYRQRQMHDYFAESTAWLTQLPDLFASESDPPYDEGPASEAEDPEKLGNPRQLLILVLKCCNYVSEDFLERVSPRLGITPKVLREMINRLRVQRGRREKEIRVLRERANSQFFRCIFYEKSLKFMPEDSVIALRLRGRLTRGRKRLEKMRKRLARLRPDPSNYQIAEVLGISKGSVDATLHILKSRWNKDQDQHILN